LKAEYLHITLQLLLGSILKAVYILMICFGSAYTVSGW